MTAVTNDMVHYGTPSRTKGVSEAKLNRVLQRTRQRQEASSTHGASAHRLTDTSCGGLGSHPQTKLPSVVTNYPSDEDDEPVLMIARRKRPE
ncbi:hypothetical protein AcW2_007763 [Taiwanofungus camphoratus]|nr:hypothetical protein AcW2_007763 [Antrodia cinnamomea]